MKDGDQGQPGRNKPSRLPSASRHHRTSRSQVLANSTVTSPLLTRHQHCRAMAAPILVRAYSATTGQAKSSSTTRRTCEPDVRALPPISSYAFADILRSVESVDFQNAINGIAELCAKNRMSLADEYASHLPPLGEITATGSLNVRPHLLRPGKRRALTSVPEASSGSSEGSRRSRGKTPVFSFQRGREAESSALRRIRIGSMGRTVSVGSATAEATIGWPLGSQGIMGASLRPRPSPAQRTPSEAALSLRRLLGSQHENHPD